MSLKHKKENLDWLSPWPAHRPCHEWWCLKQNRRKQQPGQAGTLLIIYYFRYKNPSLAHSLSFSFDSTCAGKCWRLRKIFLAETKGKPHVAIHSSLSVRRAFPVKLMTVFLEFSRQSLNKNLGRLKSMTVVVPWGWKTSSTGRANLLCFLISITELKPKIVGLKYGKGWNANNGKDEIINAM